ncbi:MAG: arginase family protein [Candidatus Dormibacteraeota bacterium]|nr:arginase family protein [Candidatus Dormibacteraeota bacterium]
MNAREWLASAQPEFPDISLVGAPVSRASISPSQAWTTPPAFRETLARFPTWEAAHEIDLAELAIRDTGDVADDRGDADGVAGRERVRTACAEAAALGGGVFVVGGDNSVTVPAMQALMASRPGDGWGLVTLDAHHDCRPLDDGPNNGTVVRELIEAGLPGKRVAQIGIHPLGNDLDNAQWAREQGVHVYPVREVRLHGAHAILHEAQLALTGAGVTSLYVDFDLDCADRSEAPACPASLPGGMAAADLIQFARLLGNHFGVAGADITEVDASADLADTTMRLAACVFLSFCAGYACRQGSQSRR